MEERIQRITGGEIVARDILRRAGRMRLIVAGFFRVQFTEKDVRQGLLHQKEQGNAGFRAGAQFRQQLVPGYVHPGQIAAHKTQHPAVQHLSRPVGAAERGGPVAGIAVLCGVA